MKEKRGASNGVLRKVHIERKKDERLLRVSPDKGERNKREKRLSRIRKSSSEVEEKSLRSWGTFSSRDSQKP